MRCPQSRFQPVLFSRAPNPILPTVVPIRAPAPRSPATAPSFNREPTATALDLGSAAGLSPRTDATGLPSDFGGRVHLTREQLSLLC